MPLIMAGMITAGCGGDTAQFVGVWEGRKEAGLTKDTPPDIRLSMERLRVVVRADGTATAVLESLPYHGTWGGGGPITIRLDRVLDKPLPENKRFSLTLNSTGEVKLDQQIIRTKKVADSETSLGRGP